MYKDKSICVVVPAYNEEKLIGKTLSTIPEFVDKIIVINDGSADGTDKIIENCKKRDARIIKLEHKKNQGVGQSLIDGYLKSLELKIDIIVVMAGDAQMDPDDLPSLILPIVENKAEYVKGNRLLTREVKNVMPRYRLIGNAILTILTKFATGYWHLIDPQCGYTAISFHALQTIDISKMTKRYGYPGDILNMLNIYNFRVKDVSVKPIYGDEKSGIRLINYIPRVSWFLIKLFFRRLIQKYLIRDFHPLILFYGFSFILFIFLCIPFTIRLLWSYFISDEVPRTTLIILVFSTIIAFQSLFFGMWMDMDYNKDLK